MKNWKIGLRITAGFAAIIVISLALGLFAINRAMEIGKKTDELSSNYFPSVLALMTVRSNLHGAVADLVQLVDSTDPREIEKLNQQIARYRASSKEAVEFYESTPFTPAEAAMYADFKATRSDFWRIFEEVRKAGEGIDPQGNVRAQAIFNTQLKPLYDRDGEELLALVEMNKKGANAGMATIRDAVTVTTRGILLGLLLAIALSIPITIFIVRSIARPLSLAVATLDRVAAGDLTATLDVHSKDEVGQMAAALNAAVEKIRATLREVGQSAAGASASSQELAAAAGEISSGAQEQAASLEETSASLEEITATVRQSADNARQASQLAAGSRESAEQGQTMVVATIAAMAEINTASAKISDIISTINDIAFQTNLLAVNAAVEAARAGEEGRGFAVVATEVRSLAQRSATAAKEIRILIQDTLQKVERGSELVNRSGATLQGIVGSVKRVTDIVGEIAAASAEQSTGVEQVNTAVTQMDHVTQSNAAQTEQLAATAQSLADQAARLSELVANFKVGELAEPPRGAVQRNPLQPTSHGRERQRSSATPATSVVAVQAGRSGGGGRSSVEGAQGSRAQGSRQKGSREQAPRPAALASHQAAGSNGDSFEEF